MPLHTVPLTTVKVNVRVVIPIASKAFTVTKYEPAGCAFVIRTTPVVGLATKVPLKLLLVETLMLVVLVGATLGVTVVFAPTATVVFG